MILVSAGLTFGPAQATELGYILDAGDTVQFDVLDDDDPAVQLPVSAEGFIQLPLAGAFKVAGLTIEDAATKINKRYVELELFVEPKVAISVATFRPIIVLGDVKSPGSVTFHPFITAEQAVGLAGGPLTALANPNDSILMTARLQNEINVNSVDVARESMLVARYAAQIAGRTAIEHNDIPTDARELIDNSMFERMSSGVELALQSEAAAFTADVSLLDDSLSEVQKQLRLLEDLVINQRKSIKFSEDGLKRTEELVKKGLRTAADLDTFQRQLMSDESRLLSTLAQISQSRNSISSLRRERGQLINNRMTDALRLHQEHSTAIDKLMATRKGLEEQLSLVANIGSEELNKSKTSVVKYIVRRRGQSGISEMDINSQTLLKPGDVLIVTISSAGQSQNTAAINSRNVVPANTN